MHSASRAGSTRWCSGEPQILGQFKDAVRTADEAGTLGALLNKLFQRTFSVAKTVRSETEIGASTVSMASAAVRLAERIYPSIAEQSALFIGAGEMIELTATHFAAQPSAPHDVRQPHARACATPCRAFSRPRDHTERSCRRSSRCTTSSSSAPRARCRLSARD